jgi:hypothetical protein
VAYALWMNDHGALRFLGRLIPALRYKAPVATPSAVAGAPVSGTAPDSALAE